MHIDWIAHKWRKLKLLSLFVPSTTPYQMDIIQKNDNLLDSTAHEALYEIQQTVPVNSNTPNLCSSLVLFWEMQCTAQGKLYSVMHCGEYRWTLFVPSLAAVCMCVSVCVCKNVHDLMFFGK